MRRDPTSAKSIMVFTHVMINHYLVGALDKSNKKKKKKGSAQTASFTWAAACGAQTFE